MSDVFLKLLNVSVTAGYIVIAALLLRLLLKKAPKWIRGILWAIVGVRLAFPFSVKSVLSLIPSAEVISPETVKYAAVPAVTSGFSTVDEIVNPVIGSVFKSDATNSVSPLQILTEIAGILWLCGLAAMLIYALITTLKIKKQIVEAVRLENGLYACDNIKTPFILGVFRPKIYLPSDIEPESAGHIISHEKAHIRRGDHLWKPLGFVLLSVYWFNPLVWLGYIFLCRDIEYACDEKVIRTLERDGAADYSEALLKFSSPAKMITACPVAFGEVGVKGRIKSVLNYKKPSFWIIILALAVCVVTAVCLLTDPKDKKADDVYYFNEAENAVFLSEDDTEVISYDRFWKILNGKDDEITAVYCNCEDKDFTFECVDVSQFFIGGGKLCITTSGVSFVKCDFDKKVFYAYNDCINFAFYNGSLFYTDHYEKTHSIYKTDDAENNRELICGDGISKRYDKDTADGALLFENAFVCDGRLYFCSMYPAGIYEYKPNGDPKAKLKREFDFSRFGDEFYVEDDSVVFSVYSEKGGGYVLYSYDIKNDKLSERGKVKSGTEVEYLKPEREYTDLEEIEKEVQENLNKFNDEEKMTQFIVYESVRQRDNYEICGYVNGEPITGKEYNVQLLRDAVSRMGEEITDEEIICEIAKQRLIFDEAKRLGKNVTEDVYADVLEKSKKDYPVSVYRSAGISEDTFMAVMRNIEEEKHYMSFYHAEIIEGLMSGKITTDSKRINELLKEMEDIQFQMKIRSSNEDTEETRALMSEYTDKMLLINDAYTNDLVDKAKISIVIR